MSTKAKIFFLGSCILSGIIIYKVHDYQNEERNVYIYIYIYLLNIKINVMNAKKKKLFSNFYSV